jgi:RNA recognition motif-containing protein
MSKHLYIDNVGPTVSLQELSDLFRQCGSVVKVTLRKGHGPTRVGQTAFVSMAEAKEALAAVQRLNGYVLAGTSMRVSEYQLSEEFVGH